MVTISQEGQTSNALEWPSEINFPSMQNYAPVSQNVDLKYFDGLFTSLNGIIFTINGEEVFGEDIINYGLSLTGVVVSTNDATHTKTVNFQVSISDFDLFEKMIDCTYFGSGSASDPYYGTLSFYIDGLSGEDGKVVVSEAATLKIYKETSSLSSEIVLSPETIELAPETNGEVAVLFVDIIPNSIQIDESKVDTDNITIAPQGKPSGNEIDSGRFTLFISISSAATTDSTYEFTVTGINTEGEEFSAIGTIYIVKP